MKKANSNIDPHSLLSLDTLLSFKKDQIEGEDKTRIAKIIGGSALYSDVVDGLDESSVEQAKSLAARVNSRIQGRVGLSTGESILGRYKFHLIAAAVMIVATIVLVTQNNEPSSSVAPLADNESEENTIESGNDVDVEHPANVDNHSTELEATDAESQMSGDNPPEEPQPT